MSRPNEPKVDKGDYYPDGPAPEWMVVPAEETSAQSPTFQYLVERAKYVEQFGDDLGRPLMDLLIEGERIKSLDDLGEIYEAIDIFYPKQSLKYGERPVTASQEAVARARFLRMALGRIFELMKFPSVLRHDLSVLLSAFPINISEPRARAQHEMEGDLNASYRVVADRAHVDQSDLSQWAKAGIVIDPNEGRRRRCPPRSRRAGKPRV